MKSNVFGDNQMAIHWNSSRVVFKRFRGTKVLVRLQLNKPIKRLALKSNIFEVLLIFEYFVKSDKELKRSEEMVL